MLYKGVFHIHTQFSYDSSVSIEKIKECMKKKNIQFAVLTEHVNEMNEEEIKKFFTECKRLSEANFLLIPALEFSCSDNRVHIIALGIKEKIEIDSPKQLIEWIREKGGLSIWAHPKREFYREIDALDMDGIEFWNIREDGRWAPSLRSLYIAKRFFKKKHTFFIAGLDLHHIEEFASLYILIHAQTLSEKEIIHAFSKGDFFIKRAPFLIKAKIFSSSTIMFFIFIRVLYIALKTPLKCAATLFRKMGLKIPASIFRKIKKIF